MKYKDSFVRSTEFFPNWVGDHYECTNGEFARMLPNRGFYFWFYSRWEDQDEDALYFMGNEL